MYQWFTARYDARGIEFEDFGGFQSRHPALQGLLREAHARCAAAGLLSPAGGRFAVNSDDVPPADGTGAFGPDVPVFCCADVRERAHRCLPDFVFGGWPEAGIEDYDRHARAIEERSAAVTTHIPKAFWMGANMHPTRGLLVRAAADRPHRMDCSFMRWDPTTGRPDRFVSLVDHADYAALLDVEGGGYSARVKLLARAGGSALLVVDRPYWDWAAARLRPEEHYLPVARDLSDLDAALDRVFQTDLSEMNARRLRFAREHLSRDAAVRHTAALVFGAELP